MDKSKSNIDLALPGHQRKVTDGWEDVLQKRMHAGDYFEEKKKRQRSVFFGKLWNVSSVLYTCRKRNLHGSLPMAQHLELRQRHFARHAHRVGPLVPLVSDVPHGVADCTMQRYGTIK